MRMLSVHRAVFTWLSKVIEELVWFWFYYALWLASVFTLVLVLRQSSENRSIFFKNSCSFPVSSNWYLLILKTSRRGPNYPSHLRFSSLIYQKRHLKSHLQQTTICNAWPSSFTLYYVYQEIISFQPVSSIRISLHSSVCFLFEQTVSLNLTFPVCLKRDSKSL